MIQAAWIITRLFLTVLLHQVSLMNIRLLKNFAGLVTNSTKHADQHFRVNGCSKQNINSDNPATVVIIHTYQRGEITPTTMASFTNHIPTATKSYNPIKMLNEQKYDKKSYFQSKLQFIHDIIQY